VTQPTTNSQKAGANNPRLSNFTLAPLYGWSINYFPYNFNSSADGGNAGKIFSQLYVRQAIQYLSTSRCTSRRSTRATASAPTACPGRAAQLVRLDDREEQPVPYNPSKAISLLKSHGWKVVRTARPPARRRAPTATSAVRASPQVRR